MAGRVRRVGLAFAMVLTMLVIDSAEPAAACSCDGRTPSIADRVGMSEIAFVGRLEVSERYDDPTSEPGPTYDLRYELVVEDPVKGVEAGDRVIMFGSSDETSCGDSLLDESLARHTVITSPSRGRYVGDSTPSCSRLPSAEALLATDLSLPETSPGPVSVVVFGRLGEAELVGFDSLGRPVVFGDLTGQAGDFAVCPGGDRIVQLEQPPESELVQLTTRAVGSLDVIDRVDLRPPATSSEAFGHHIRGAALTCGVAETTDVLAVLSWENSSDGQTLIVHIDNAAESVTVSAHDRASRAAYDPRADGVVAVSDGHLVVYDIHHGDERIIARLTDPASESDYDAIFIAPDPDRGWWVGLGDGDRQLATRLHVLAHVGPDGAVERWPTTLTEDLYINRAVVEGDTILTDTHRIRLPTLGSTSNDATLSVSRVTERAHGLPLADGRSVQNYVGDDGSSVHLNNIDGTSVVLEGLHRARRAIALSDGPVVEPGSVDRSFHTTRVESRWVVPHDTFAEEGPSQTIGEPSSLSSPLGEPSAARAAEPESFSSRWWLAAGIVVLVLVLSVGRSIRGRRVS